MTRPFDPGLRAAVDAAWGLPQVQAMLRVIRQGESLQTDDAFFLRWGGTGQPPKRFTDLSRHPRILEPGPNGPSSAAGAYQITMTTYDEFAPQLGITDFSRDSQGMIAVGIIAHHGAIEDVIAGRLREALAKCAGRWASFPDSLAGQKRRQYDELARTFVRYGGVLEGQAAPIEERDVSGALPLPEDGGGFMDKVVDWFGQAASVAGQAATAAAPVAAAVNPAIGLALGLAGKLIECFEPLAKEKITKELARHTDPAVAAKIADNMLTKAKEITGHDDEVAAVAAVRADPEKIAVVQADVLDDLARMAPMLKALGDEDNRVAAQTIAAQDAAEARNRGNANDQDPYLTSAIVRMMYGVTAALGAGIVALYYTKGAIPGELLAIFAGLVGTIGTKFSTRMDHRYGSAHQSTAAQIIDARLRR